MPNAPDPLRYDGHVLDPDEVTGIFVSLIATGDRVLDVGCGTGSITRILADTCRTEVGIEPDAERATRAISRGLKVHIGRLNSELIRTTGLFDVVLFADVQEHLADPHSMLLAAREALRPRGSVIISVPKVAHWSVRAEMVFRERFQYQATGIMGATHLRWFSADSAKSLLASAGFRVTAYRATAGTTFLDKNMRRPLRWLPAESRAVFLRFASKQWPTLFGCQRVLKAEMA